MAQNIAEPKKSLVKNGAPSVNEKPRNKIDAATDACHTVPYRSGEAKGVYLILISCLSLLDMFWS